TEIAIYGLEGNDNITVQSSVNIITLLYGGSGNNNLVAAGSNQNFIVTIGGSGKNVVTGNGINTAFWVAPGDTVNASAKEIAAGGVHTVSSFYGGVSTQLNGQNLADPTDSGKTANYKNYSLFGSRPLHTDINQGSLADCYFLASLASFAYSMPGRLMQMAVDLGDGTYAVQFKRNGTMQYVRVDADLPVNSSGNLIYNKIKSGGAIWGSIMEKAYAFFRNGKGTYTSLNLGWTGNVYSDFGVSNSTFLTNVSATSLYNTISNALAAGKAISIVSKTSTSSPISASHAYSIFDAYTSNGTMYVVVKNPFGTGNNNGLITLTIAQLISNFSNGTISS
ncbi:MAG: C2 family cysteine protease, partial [Phycisphaerales bacterium]|nr:C2 family cysteine protease [Phycisphaerales bacterium]